MGRTKKTANAALETVKGEQTPQDIREDMDTEDVPDPIQGIIAPEGTSDPIQETIGPEDEAELLGCQDGDGPDLPVQYAVAADPGLNLREGPSKAAPIITELPCGVGLFPTGVTQGAWCEVTTGRLTGWVMGEFLEPLWN